MDMPRPNEFHQKLAAFAGDWIGDETMHPSPWDPQGGKTTGTYHCRVVCDGFAVVQEYEQKRDGVVCFRGHGVFGYDVQQNCYLWHWTDSMGGMPCSATKGQWVGDTIVWENESPMGKSRYTHTFLADGRCNFKIEVSQDGATWALLMEGTYAKVTASAARAPGKQAKRPGKVAKAPTKKVRAAAKKPAKAAKSAKSAKLAKAAKKTKPTRQVAGKRRR